MDLLVEQVWKMQEKERSTNRCSALMNNIYHDITYASNGNTWHHQHILSVGKMVTFTNRSFLLVLRSNCDRLQYLLVKLIPLPLSTKICEHVDICWYNILPTENMLIVTEKSMVVKVTFLLWLFDNLCLTATLETSVMMSWSQLAYYSLRLPSWAWGGWLFWERC